MESWTRFCFSFFLIKWNSRSPASPSILLSSFSIRVSHSFVIEMIFNEINDARLLLSISMDLFVWSTQSYFLHHLLNKLTIYNGVVIRRRKKDKDKVVCNCVKCCAVLCQPHPQSMTDSFLFKMFTESYSTIIWETVLFNFLSVFWHKRNENGRKKKSEEKTYRRSNRNNKTRCASVYLLAYADIIEPLMMSCSVVKM